MAGDRKSVVVTGGASGIGRAAAERLARGGWDVLAVDLNAEQLAWTEGAEHVSAMTADVSSEEDNQRIADEADKLFGGLDAAIFNAGITGGGSIDAMPTENFQRVFSINMMGPVLGIRAMLPLLRKRENGSIVVTSSTMGVGGDSENWAYGMAKHALIGLVRSLSRELGWEGIRINALCPGPTKTGMTGNIEEVAPAHYDLLKRAVPLQRWAEADEMASVMEFLVSPGASYVTGHAMVADGGTIVGTGLLEPKAGSQNVIPGGINEVELADER
ncbi:MAG: SDR family NAD(P)-dependent oxidoreductase [Novosphingobium sp.]|nr:SDR family NAD(P)-dependent oxidoreductase [Novosphingobium sp.]